jgi:hypothetical protein
MPTTVVRPVRLAHTVQVRFDDSRNQQMVIVCHNKYIGKDNATRDHDDDVVMEDSPADGDRLSMAMHRHRLAYRQWMRAGCA